MWQWCGAVVFCNYFENIFNMTCHLFTQLSEMLDSYACFTPQAWASRQRTTSHHCRLTRVVTLEVFLQRHRSSSKATHFFTKTTIHFFLEVGHLSLTFIKFWKFINMGEPHVNSHVKCNKINNSDHVISVILYQGLATFWAWSAIFNFSG